MIIFQDKKWDKFALCTHNDSNFLLLENDTEKMVVKMDFDFLQKFEVETKNFMLNKK